MPLEFLFRRSWILDRKQPSDTPVEASTCWALNFNAELPQCRGPIPRDDAGRCWPRGVPLCQHSRIAQRAPIFALRAHAALMLHDLPRPRSQPSTSSASSALGFCSLAKCLRMFTWALGVAGVATLFQTAVALGSNAAIAELPYPRSLKMLANACFANLLRSCFRRAAAPTAFREGNPQNANDKAAKQLFGSQFKSLGKTFYRAPS